MANDKFDSKSFNPQAFKYMVGRVPNLHMHEIKKSKALAGNPDIKDVFSTQNGTSYARIAMRGLLDGDAVNYDGQTDMELSYVAVQATRPKKKAVDWVGITETFIAGGMWVIVFMMLGAALAVQVL